MRKIVAAVAAASVLLAGAADGAVLCQKRSGTVLVRAACKKKETLLDLSQFGALGPKGDKGDAGTGRAYGHILANGTLDANYANAGIVGVRTSPTYFCIKLDPSIDAVKAMAVVSVDETDVSNLANGANSDLKVARFMGTTAICTQGNELTVATATLFFNAGALQSAGIGPLPFYIVVP